MVTRYYIPDPPVIHKPVHLCFECKIPLNPEHLGKELCDCCWTMLEAIQSPWFRHWHQVWLDCQRRSHADNLET